MIEKGSRERIEIERKETKGNRVNNLKRRIRNITLAPACCSASSRHCISPEVRTTFCNKAPNYFREEVCRYTLR